MTITQYGIRSQSINQKEGNTSCTSQTRPWHHGGCRFWQPVQADSQPKSSGLVLSRRPLDALLRSSNEPGELSQWLCHDDSTINIVLVIFIIIILNRGDSLKLACGTPTARRTPLAAASCCVTDFFSRKTRCGALQWKPCVSDVRDRCRRRHKAVRHTAVVRASSRSRRCRC